VATDGYALQVGELRQLVEDQAIEPGLPLVHDHRQRWRVVGELVADRREVEPVAHGDAADHRLDQAPHAQESLRPAREDGHGRAVEPVLRQRGQHGRHLALEHVTLGVGEHVGPRPRQVVEERPVVAAAGARVRREIGGERQVREAQVRQRGERLW
jgi:hypothetical protein